MSAPAIPARLAHRPTVGGLVVPYVSVDFADGTYALGELHRRKSDQCIAQYRCQLDGQRLGRPLVVLTSEKMLAEDFSSEAALHPECAAYSIKACPMVAGRMAHYLSKARAPGKPCNKPGCECGGWVQNDTGADRTAERAASPWYAVWLDDYLITVNNERQRQITGLSWRGITPRRIRRIGCPVQAAP